MVKIGFLVEGDTEKVLLESENFRNYLFEHQIEFVPEVINASGNRNLLPKNITPHINRLESSGAQKIVILADLDTDACITMTKQRIDPERQHITVVCVKEVEAWFLADTTALRSLLRSLDIFIEKPEQFEKPSRELNSLRSAHLGKKNRSKVALAKELLGSGFLIQNAAQHPNCSSVRYFLQKLEELSHRTK